MRVVGGVDPGGLVTHSGTGRFRGPLGFKCQVTEKSVEHFSDLACLACKRIEIPVRDRACVFGNEQVILELGR